MDQTGFPLEISCHEGNTAETTTIVPIVTGFLQRHGLADTPMVVAADAGMLSASNLKVKRPGSAGNLDVPRVSWSRVAGFQATGWVVW